MARETYPAMLMITSSPAPLLACHHQARPPVTTPHARRRRQPGAVLPLGGAVAPVAPMCANAGQFWRANCRQHDLVFIGRNSAGALRVMTRHDPLPVSL